MEKRHYKRLSYTDRLKIEALYNHHTSIREIAEELRRPVQSIYREVKRGLYETYDGEYYKVTRYSADRSEQSHRFSQSACGSSLKIGNDHLFRKTVEHLIVDEHLSPYASLQAIRQKYPEIKTSVCVTTLYSYIDRGLFLRIKNNDLWYRSHRKKKKKSKPRPRSAPRGTSIELRPFSPTVRTFGHWELDSVIGRNEKGNTLLVLTERKTRQEILIRSMDKSSGSTLDSMNTISRAFGKLFPQVFQSITVDNGSEFFGLTKAFPGVPFYWCHPSCPSERGSNENQNRIIRRFIKKGTRIETYSDDQIHAVEDYLNNLPRKILGGKTSAQCFSEELSKLF